MLRTHNPQRMNDASDATRDPCAAGPKAADYPDVSKATALLPSPLKAPLHSSTRLARAGMKQQRRLTELGDGALCAVFGLLTPAERREVIPLVCRKFRDVCARCPALWEQAHITLPAEPHVSLDLAAMFTWFLARADGEAPVRSLHADLAAADGWAPLLGVLGAVGRGLHHLRIAGEGPECRRPGCTAPWLALTPNLLSLELDEVCDAAVSNARFPPGARLQRASFGGHACMHTCMRLWPCRVRVRSQ